MTKRYENAVAFGELGFAFLSEAVRFRAFFNLS